MNDQFVTYEIALALKELGFKEKCLTAYTNKGELGSVWNVDPDICEGELLMEYADNSLYCINGELLLDYIAASLWQQVIDWFNNKYGIFITLALVSNGYGFYIHKNFNTTNKGENYGFYPDIYKAREAAILKCIELCKQ